MVTEVYMPKVTDHMTEGLIIDWLVTEGDQVEQGQPLLEMETDKAVVVLEAPASGIVKGVRGGVKAGAIVPVGETIAYIADAGEMVTMLPPLTSGATGDASRLKEPEPGSLMPQEVVRTSRPETDKPRAVPAVRRLAKDLGIDLILVKATGTDGRTTKQDVLAFHNSELVRESKMGLPRESTPVARRVAEALDVNLTGIRGTGHQGRVTKEDVLRHTYVGESLDRPSHASHHADADWLELTNRQQLTRSLMVQSVQTAPQFTLHVKADMSNVLELRNLLAPRLEMTSGLRPSITGILVKIVADALRRYPRANASFIDGRIRLHKAVNIGVAVGSDEGLVVPVVKDADRRSLTEITEMLLSFKNKAETMRFSPDELSGGTFTISNLGMHGIEHFNAIVNPPEGAILAIGRVISTPVGMPDDSISLRPLMSLNLTVDHRCMDGLQGAKLLSKAKELIEEPYLVLE